MYPGHHVHRAFQGRGMPLNPLDDPFYHHHLHHHPLAYHHHLPQQRVAVTTQVPNQQMMTMMAPEPKASPQAKPYLIEELPLVQLEEIDLADSVNRACPVCLEDFTLGARVKRMPCAHFYCEECLEDWLLRHCSCPICRYELPTDDVAYEKERRKRMRNRSPRFRRHELRRLSVKELKGFLHRLEQYKPVDKTDLIEHLILSKAIHLIPEPHEDAKVAAPTSADVETAHVGEKKSLTDTDQESAHARTAVSQAGIEVETVIDSDDEESVPELCDDAIELFPWATASCETGTSASVDAKSCTKGNKPASQPAKTSVGSEPCAKAEPSSQPATVARRTVPANVHQEAPGVACSDEDLWIPSESTLGHCFASGSAPKTNLILSINSQEQLQSHIDQSKFHGRGLVLLLTDKLTDSEAFACLGHVHGNAVNCQLNFAECINANADVARFLSKDSFAQQKYPFLLATIPTPTGLKFDWFDESMNETTVTNWIKRVQFQVSLYHSSVWPIDSENDMQGLLNNAGRRRSSAIVLFSNGSGGQMVSWHTPQARKQVRKLYARLADSFRHQEVEFGECTSPSNDVARKFPSFSDGPLLLAFLPTSRTNFQPHRYEGSMHDEVSLRQWVNGVLMALRQAAG